MTHTTQFTTASRTLSRMGATEQSHQDYLRLSQSARAAAVVARRAASAALWAAISGAIAAALRSASGHHASVRVAAGHQVHRLGV